MVYDTVCHDLGKTYPEVRKLHPAEILFHFHHARRRKEEHVEEINNILEYFMRLINPEMYNEYIRLKDADEFEVATYSENMDEDTFRQMIAAAESRYKRDAATLHTKAATAVDEGDVPVPPTAPPAASTPQRNPFKFGRPPDLPPLVIGNNNQAVPPEDTDFNPVSFRKWE